MGKRIDAPMLLRMVGSALGRIEEPKILAFLKMEK